MRKWHEPGQFLGFHQQATVVMTGHTELKDAVIRIELPGRIPVHLDFGCRAQSRFRFDWLLRRYRFWFYPPNGHSRAGILPFLREHRFPPALVNFRLGVLIL